MDKRNALNRREFLGAVAGGAALLGAATAAEPKQRWPMRMSASSVAFTRLPIEQACERIGALGFEAIDIWANFAGCTHLEDAAKRLGADGLKALLAKNKLALNAFSIYTTGYEPYAELLGQMGGGLAIRGSEGGEPKPEELTDRMKKFLESLKPLADLAEKHNSYVAIENHGGALLHTLDSLKAFADLNTSPRLGVALAPYHLEGIGVAMADAIRTLDKHLFFFYAWQQQPETGQLPGHGPTDFGPAIEALAQIDYKHYVNPFMHGEPEPDAMAEALKKSRAYLLDCYEKKVAI